MTPIDAMNGSTSDSETEQIEGVLAAYKHAHASAQINVKRRNSVSIRIRIIDPDFVGLDKIDREPSVWKLLETLPENVFTNITMVLLLTPQEAEKSLANLEFEDPVPSRL